jgi:hypothetical protein
MSARTTFTKEEAEQIASALGVDWSAVEFGIDDFRAGLDVELEHGRRDPATNVTDDDPILTGKIALAHLHELPDYYVRLAEMEGEG